MLFYFDILFCQLRF